MPVTIAQSIAQRFHAALITHFPKRDGSLATDHPIGILEQVNLDLNLILDLLFFKNDVPRQFRCRLNWYRLLSGKLGRHLIGKFIGHRL